jgi:nucleoside-diphosphate-sugar epimerase
VTGCYSQIGIPLVHALCDEVGERNVFAADTREKKEIEVPCKFVTLDVTNQSLYKKIVIDNRIDYIVHLEALMFDLGERFPNPAT